MGEQTCVVLFAFAVIHTALILSAISLGTPFWIKADDNATTITTNQTTNVTSKGLWEFCQYGECTALNQTIQTGKYGSPNTMYPFVLTNVRVQP